MFFKKNFNKIRLNVRKRNFELNSSTYLKKMSDLFYSSKKKNRNIFARRLIRRKIEIKSNSIFFNKFRNIFKVSSIIYLVSLSYGFIYDYQIELVRRLLKNCVSKYSILVKRVIPFLKVTKRSNQMRMGGGKNGKIVCMRSPVYPGCVIFELRGVLLKHVNNVLKLILDKLCFKVCFVSVRNI